MPRKKNKMKLTKFTKLLVIGLTLSITAIGCRKGPVGVTPLPGARVHQVPEPPPGGSFGSGPGGRGVETAPSPTGIASNPPGPHEGYSRDTQIFQADTVYFAFDSSVVKAGERMKVVAVADYLKANASCAVEIQGHCDERGTEEYNRALGERRALALREDLVSQGIEPGRVDTISYGKDRPAVEGHDEAAWSKNRRGEFILLTAPK